MTDPQRLVDELVRAGWTIVGNSGRNACLIWPGTLNQRALLVPLNPEAADFDQLWSTALGHLEDAMNVGVKAAYVLAGIHPIART